MIKENDKPFREKVWNMMIDEALSGDQLKVNRENLQDVNQWYVEKHLLPGPVVGRRVYINGVLQK